MQIPEIKWKLQLQGSESNIEKKARKYAQRTYCNLLRLYSKYKTEENFIESPTQMAFPHCDIKWYTADLFVVRAYTKEGRMHWAFAVLYITPSALWMNSDQIPNMRNKAFILLLNGRFFIFQHKKSNRYKIKI